MKISIIYINLGYEDQDPREQYNLLEKTVYQSGYSKGNKEKGDSGFSH